MTTKTRNLKISQNEAAAIIRWAGVADQEAVGFGGEADKALIRKIFKIFPTLKTPSDENLIG